MTNIFADTIAITTVHSWTNTPTIVGLYYALAGAVFVSIYYLRRRKV